MNKKSNTLNQYDLKSPSTRGPAKKAHSQKNLILCVLENGGSYTERELGRITRGRECLGSRAIVSQLRNDGYKIAHKKHYNEQTKRFNVKYYLEDSVERWMIYCKQNGYFHFSPGPKC